jgi:CBS-domain-containing membrane protein
LVLQFVGGQVVSAVVGVCVRLAIRVPWVASPVGTALAILAMELTQTTHPPGQDACTFMGVCGVGWGGGGGT